MRLSDLVCENFRGFRQLRMTLDPSFTLIVGANGAGKTAVIDALAVVLDGWLRAFPGASRRSIDRKRDVRRQPVQRGGLVALETALPCRVSGRGVFDGQAFVHERQIDTAGADQGAEANPIATSARARGLAGELLDLPLIARFGTERMRSGRAHEPYPRSEAVEAEVSEGYRHCLHTTLSHGHFEAWMRWREEVRLQEMSTVIAAGESTDAVLSPHRDAVEAAVCACVPGARAFRYDLAHQELRFSFEDERQLPFALLSGGYRSLLGMVADMAWRAVTLNPWHGADAPSKTEGVVLIDEIDLHLHPRWQRLVIANVRAAFPRVQFVATTHSPQVVGSAKAEWVRLLDSQGQVLTVDHAEGRDSNALLEDIFGTGARPEATAAEIQEMFAAIEREQYAEGRARLASLAARLGQDDADVVRAQWLLDQEDR